ncbi:MAG: carbohydrate-binding domain-containing protein, partial [Lachnospiraceae bacterium]|nr:carbohydrate-binding domain-containing protein [Lachnospiraceae bacterium]
MKHYRRFIVLFINFVVLICLLLGFSHLVSAEDTDDFTITTTSSGYSYADNLLTITGGGNYEINGSSTTDTIKVTSEDDVTLILSGVSISSESTSPIEISGNGDVTIMLSGLNTLTATSSWSVTEYAALQLSSDSTLTVTSADGDNETSGSLSVSAYSGAGIGSKSESNLTGNIVINGGTVSATSSIGAGIGSGSGADITGSITINGGNVTASGTATGAGIGGGGNGGLGSNITITGGTVTASGATFRNFSSAAIGGGGSGGKCSNITISGGYITLSKGSKASYIGGGNGGEARNITITGGYFADSNYTAGEDGTVYECAVADGCVVYATEDSEAYPCYVLQVDDTGNTDDTDDADKDNRKAVQFGTGDINGYSEVEGYDYIYYGYWTAPDSYTTSGAIKWRVLDTQTNTGSTGLFLLTDALYGSSSSYGDVFFKKDGSSNVWQGSDAQAWCRDFAGIEGDSVTDAFTTSELNAILLTTKSDSAYTSLKDLEFSAGTLSSEKVFFLSSEEAETAKYGFDSWVSSSWFAYYGDAIGTWWLRSGSSNSMAAGVGAVSGAKSFVSASNITYGCAARPAFNLDTSKVIFASAADNSGHNSFSVTEDYSGSDWKLTLADNNSFATNTTISGTTVLAGAELTVSHVALSSLSADYTNVTAVLLDGDGNLICYGSVNSDTSATSSILTIPETLKDGTYTLLVYGEDWNDAYLTDYATATPFTTTIEVSHDHSYDTNGFCINCGSYEPATLNTDGVYEIVNTGQLFWFAALVNGDTSQEGITAAIADADAVLIADIDLSVTTATHTSTEWTPIGNTSAFRNYSGTFDGLGHTVSGLYINNSSAAMLGMFGYLAPGGTVQNLAVEGSVTGYDMVGSIVGLNHGTVTNCYANCTVSGEKVAGGVVGYNAATLINCYSIGTVSSNASDHGGVTGRNETSGIVTNCYYLEGMATAAIGLDNGSPTSVEVKTAEEFASGEVTYLLNSGMTDGTQVWYQNLDNGETVDSYPVLDSSHGTVYCVACDNSSAYYSNNNSAVIHVGGSYDSNGFCTRCGYGYQPATQNSEGVYEITNAGQLFWFACLVNGDTTQEDITAAVPDACAVLTDDIDLSVTTTTHMDTEWTPIGTESEPYTGTFDGDGYEIAGLKITTAADYVGLFGYVMGTVKDLTVSGDINVSGNTMHVGGIVGTVKNGTLQGLTSYVNVTAYDGEKGIFGGVVASVEGDNGTAGSTVERCAYYGTVRANGVLDCVGGITGYMNAATITNCINYGTVDTNGGTAAALTAIYTGGIVGYLNNANAVVTNCVNVGTVSGADSSGFTSYTGAVIGRINQYVKEVANCYYLKSDLDGIAANGSSVTADVIEKTADELASGEVTYLLNGSTSEGSIVWYQNIDNDETADSYPVLNSSSGTVYYGTDCSGKAIYSNTTVPAAEHNYESVVTEPTCTENSYTTYTCSICGDSYTADETEATGHSYESVVTEPTCITGGYTTHTCTVCGDSYIDSETEALGHSWNEGEVTREATCTEEGVRTYTCTVCGETKTEAISAKGHTSGEAVKENEVAATCTTDGSYESVVYCTECGAELSRETITVPATGHTPGEAVKENEKAATCTEDGSYESVVYCTECGEELSRETVTIPATG